MGGKSDNLNRRVLPKQLTSKQQKSKATGIFSFMSPKLIILAILSVMILLLLMLMWWSKMLLFLIISFAYLSYQAGLDWMMIKKMVIWMMDQFWQTSKKYK